MSQTRIIFNAEPVAKNFLSNVSASERSKIINNLIKDFMSKKNGQVDELGKDPVAITAAIGGLSALSLLPDGKQRVFPRGQEFKQTLMAEIKQAVAVDIKTANKVNPWDDLLNIASASYIYGYLFLAYHQATGSQLELLFELYGGSFSVARAHLIYDRAKLNHPAIFEKWSFDKWLDFLLGAGLITVNSDDNLCKSTSAGKELMRFCLNQQLPLNKAL